MQGASETGLISGCFQAWFEIMDTTKKEDFLQHQMQQKSAQMGDFNDRNKKGAMSATAKVAYLHDIQFMLWAFTVMKREIKVERARRYFKEKNEKKKQDLIGVKGLFKNFATELESNLKKGTPRGEVKDSTSPKAR